MEPTQTSKKAIIGIIIALVIIIAVTLFITIRDNDEAANGPVIRNDTQAIADFIDVKDQFPGDIVFVNDVQLGKSGFLVVTEVDATTSAPGEIIGDAYVEAPGKATSIDLDKSTVEGKSYYLMIWNDENGNKYLDASTGDSPRVDTADMVIFKMFKATTDLGEVKG